MNYCEGTDWRKSVDLLTGEDVTVRKSSALSGKSGKLLIVDHDVRP